MPSTATSPPQLGLSWENPEMNVSLSSLSISSNPPSTTTTLGSYFAVFDDSMSSINTECTLVEEYPECPLASFGADAEYEPRHASSSSSICSGSAATARCQSPARHADAVQRLGYSRKDLQSLSDNENQFNLLKRSLRKKGAVTNEMLKQKLPLFLSYTKSRKVAPCSKPASSTGPEPLPRRSSLTRAKNGASAA